MIDIDKMKESILDVKDIQLKYLDASTMPVYHALDKAMTEITKSIELFAGVK